MAATVTHPELELANSHRNSFYMLLDESRLFRCVSIKSKKLRFALIWERPERAAGGVCKRREEEISWQRQWVCSRRWLWEVGRRVEKRKR